MLSPGRFRAIMPPVRRLLPAVTWLFSHCPGGTYAGRAFFCCFEHHPADFDVHHRSTTWRRPPAGPVDDDVHRGIPRWRPDSGEVQPGGGGRRAGRGHVPGDHVGQRARRHAVLLPPHARHGRRAKQDDGRSGALGGVEHSRDGNRSARRPAERRAAAERRLPVQRDGPGVSRARRRGDRSAPSLRVRALRARHEARRATRRRRLRVARRTS